MAVWSDVSSASDAAKNLSDVEFDRLLASLESRGMESLGTLREIVASLADSINSLGLRAGLLSKRIQSDSGEEAKVARALKAKLEATADDVRKRCAKTARRYLSVQREMLTQIAENAEAFDKALGEPTGKEASTLEHLLYQLQDESRRDNKIASGVSDDVAALEALLTDLDAAAGKNRESMLGPLRSTVSDIEAEIKKCESELKKIPGHGKNKRNLGQDIFAMKDVNDLRSEILYTRLKLLREQRRLMKQELDKLEEMEGRSSNAQQIRALRTAITSLRNAGGPKAKKLTKPIEELLEDCIGAVKSVKVDEAQIEALKSILEIRRSELDKATSKAASERTDALYEVIVMLEARRAKLKEELKSLPRCTASAKAKYEAKLDIVRRIGECANPLKALLQDLESAAESSKRMQLDALQNLVDVLKKANKRPVESLKALDGLKSEMNSLRGRI